MKFTELNDKQWNMIERHIPKPAHTGRPRNNDRMRINGIIYVLILEYRWSEMPKIYGDDSTANLRLRKWQQKGVWKKILSGVIKTAHKQNKICKTYQLIHHLFRLKRGKMIGFNGFKRITGTKIHVAVESNGLPVSIITSPANIHDSTKFIDVVELISDFVESISDFADNKMCQEIISVYADKGYDSTSIRDYLESRNMIPCIPFRKNNKTEHDDASQNNYNKTRFVVGRFFAWLKNGFHRTRIRYEKNCDNYLGLINIASFLMYCGVLR